MKESTLSVLMCNYNHARFLPDSLGAICSQSYRPLEFIIIDDASEDNSVEIIEGFASKDPTIRLIRNKYNMGVGHNISMLLKLAKGDLLTFQSADDKVLPGFFEKSVALLNQYPQAGLCSSRSRLMDENGNDIGVMPNFYVSKHPRYFTPGDSLNLLKKFGYWFCGNAMVVRRNAIIESGGFSPRLGPFADGFLHEIISLKYGACFIPESLAYYRLMETQYFRSFLADSEKHLNIIQHAGHLMRINYFNLLSLDYIVRWEKEQFYSIFIKMLLSSFKNLEDQFPLNFLTLIGMKINWLDIFFWRLNRLQIEPLNLLFKIYGLVKLKLLTKFFVQRFYRWQSR